MAVFQSMSGLDSLTGTSSDDSFVFTQFSNDPGDIFDGSGGNDSVDLSIGPGSVFALTVYDFTSANITSIENINFIGAGRNREAAFYSSQFGAGLSNSLSVSASDLSQRIIVTMDAPGTFSAAHWTFSNWSNNTGQMAYDDLVVISGSSAGDSITGSSSVDYLYGNTGDDTLLGGDGADTLTGGLGLDQVLGGAGNDILIINDSNDVITGEVYDGGSEYDILLLSNSVSDLSTVTLTGIEMLQGNGANTVKLTTAQVAGFTTFYNTDVSLAESGTVTLTSTQAANYYLNTLGNTLDGSAVAGDLNVYASYGNGSVVVKGGTGNDYIRGGAGQDVLIGGNGNDELAGGYDDQLFGEAGNDSLRLGYNAIGDGGLGFDTLFLSGFNQPLGINIDLSAMWTGGTVSNGTGTLTGFEALGLIGGSDGDDIITIGTGGFVAGGLAPPAVVGGDGNDHLTGGDDRDLLYGDNGDDTLIGLGGDDQLGGFDGNDYIDSGDGDDFLSGGLGADVLIGGAGGDTYIYVQGDTPSEDVISESANDSGTDVLSMYALTYINDAAFSNVRNIEVVQFSNNTDLNGDDVVLGSQFQATEIRSVITSTDVDATILNAGINFIVALPHSPLTVRAGSGDDIFTFDKYTLPSYNNTYTLSGGAGYDTLVFSKAAEASSLVPRTNNSGPYQSALSLSGFEAIRLTGLRETAVANAPDIAGTAGDYKLTLTDAVVAAGQTMTVDARALNVNVVGYLGTDNEIGGVGANADILLSDRVILDASSLSANRAVHLLGGATNDTAIGGTWNDVLDGGDGADNLDGGRGNDTLDGGSGSDALDGGDGNDRIYWDAADNHANITGGAGFDRLVMKDGIAIPSFNYAAQGFELLEIETNDLGGTQNWSRQSQTYNLALQLVEYATRYDDGSHVAVTLDPGNANATNQVVSYYDTLDRLAQVDQVNDDASRIIFNYDPAGASALSSDIVYYDNLGRLDRWDQNYDNGSRIAIDYDQANTTTLSSSLVYYDDQNRLDRWTQNYDNGSRVVIDYDQGNASALSSSLVYYDSQSKIDLWDQNYDNGSRVVIDYDQANASALSSSLVYYDNQSRLDRWDQNYDDGSRVVVDYDAANASNLANELLYFDTQARIDLWDRNYDDGSRILVDFDQDNSQSWNQHVLTYNAQGALVGDVLI